MSIKKRINDLFLALFYFERRIDPPLRSGKGAVVLRR